MWKGKREAERVILLTPGDIRLINPILEVWNVFARAVPVHFLRFLALFWQNWYLHPVIKQIIRLRVINNIELDFLPGTSVDHSEVEPLSVSISIDIILHHEIILIIVYFLGEKQIATLEATFKQQCSVLIALKSVDVWLYLFNFCLSHFDQVFSDLLLVVRHYLC